MSKEIILNEKNFEQEAIKNSGATLVDFWAEWCAPCRVQNPILEELAGEGYRVGKLNVDENQEISSRYGVRSIPTLIIFKGGQPVEQMVGVRSKEELKRKIDEWQAK